jgi:hypothetical protein
MPQLPEEGTRAPASPHGLDEIIATFGDIFEYMGPDHTLSPSWQEDNLQRITLPFSMPLSWDTARCITQITCHRLLSESFREVFARIADEKLASKVTSFGGCFSFRPQRTGTKLSTHAWGIAIDLNPETNQQGTAGAMDAALVNIFQSAAFSWGGDWRGRVRDPMHFQFCTGY